MGTMKVGDLQAEVSLKDDLTKDLAKVERNFKKTGKDMEASAKLDLDDSKLSGGLAHAKTRMKDGAKQGMDGMSEAVTAGMGPLGDKLSIGLGGIGALAGGTLYEGLMKGFERKAGAAQLGAQLGLDPATAQVLGVHAAEIYGEAYGETLGQVNDAIKFVTRDIGGLGDITKEQFDEMVKNGLNLASVFGRELGGERGVISNVGQLIRTGLVKDANDGFDLITIGLQGPADKAEDLLETFNEYAPLFQALGLDGKTALGLLKQGVEGGARSADVAADALKEFTLLGKEATNPQVIDAFTKLGLSSWQMTQDIAAGGPRAAKALQLMTDRLRAVKNPVDQNAIAVQLFGTKAEDMQKSLFKFDPSKAVAGLGNVEGAAKRVNDTVGDTAEAKMESWKRNAETKVVTFIDESMVPKLGELQTAWTENIGTMDDFTAGQARISDGWSNNIGTMQDFKTGLNEIGGWLSWLKNDIIDPTVGSVQDLTLAFSDLSTKVNNLPGAQETGIDLLAPVKGSFAPIAGLIGALGFDDGGFVPGPMGAPRMAVVHGGEEVIPHHKSGAGGGPAGGRGSSVTITVPVYLSGRQIGTATAQHDLGLS